MNRILFAEPPDRRPLPPVECTRWCLTGDAHIDAVHPSEQRCQGYPHRIEASEGGGSGEDRCTNSPGALVMQVEKQGGQPATIVVGIQLLDREYFVRFNLPEFATALRYGQIAHAQAQTA